MHLCARRCPRDKGNSIRSTSRHKHFSFPRRACLPCTQALRLPEPLSAQLLRQREQAAQQGQAAQSQRGGLGGGMQHTTGVQRGPWRPRGRRGWEEERRRREWEEEQLRMEAEAQAMAAAAADQVRWRLQGVS